MRTTPSGVSLIELDQLDTFTERQFFNMLSRNRSESAVSAVTVVEVEAALLRIGRGEADHNDANLLRSVIQKLEGTIRQYETIFEDENHSSGINAHIQST